MHRLSRSDTRFAAIVAAAAAIVATTCAFWFASSGPLLAQGASHILIALGRLAGLALMLTVLTQLVLSSRAPFLDWSDRLSAPRVHRFLGFSTGALLLTHLSLLAAGYGGAAWFSQLIGFLSWEDVALAYLAGIIILAIGALSVRAIRSRLRYEWWYRAHLSLYLAIYVAIGHQLQTGDMADGLARAFWITLMIAAGATLLAYRVARPLIAFARHRFRVERIVRESPSSVSIYIGGRDLDAFRFAAGQFAYLTFLAMGFSAHHPFSFSAVPGSGSLRFTIKSLGDFTQDAERIPLGTPVIIDGPLGHLTSAVAAAPARCLIAGGIGITAIAALASEAPERSVVLVANRSRSDAPLVDELRERGITLHEYYSDATPRQRIDAHEVLRVCPDAHARDIYLCGPDRMMDELGAGLRALGIARSRIHTERFAL